MIEFMHGLFEFIWDAFALIGIICTILAFIIYLDHKNLEKNK